MITSERASRAKRRVAVEQRDALSSGSYGSQAV